MPQVLLVDDDDDYAFALSHLLRGCGLLVDVAHSAAAARAAVRDRVSARPYDVALVDLGLPDTDGLGLIEELAVIDPLLPIVCVTGRVDPSAVVQAMRRGALDYLAKPAAKSVVLAAVTSAAATSVARRSASAAASASASGRKGQHAVGSSPAWARAMSLVAAAAAVPRTTVLFTGEPGVGKEVAANLLHALSSRSKRPLVSANAACFSPGLMESEIFGHEAGSFTGAAKRRKGLFEQADQGVLFLDEIGELPLDLQSKLLRVLENHPFRRVGGEDPVSVDVRLVTATNRDLPALVREGRFRSDLYERIRVFEVHLPPLRERRSDIATLAHHFLARLTAELGQPTPDIDPDTLVVLESWNWPGNVRELRNVIERALVMSAGGTISRRHLPEHLQAPPARTAMAAMAMIEQDAMTGSSSPGASPALSTSTAPIVVALGRTATPIGTEAPASGDPRSLESMTRAHIEAVFQEMGGNVTRAATRLGMSRLTLRKKLQAYGLRPVKE